MSTLKLNTTSGGSVNLVPDDTAANLTISPQTGYYLPAGTGAVATTVQAKLRESVSVLDFGADPTGVADSATALTNALATSLPVFLPPGTYSLGSAVTLPTGAVIFSNGRSGVIKHAAGVLHSLFTAASVSNIRLQSIKIDGNMANVTTAANRWNRPITALFTSCTNVIIDDCEITATKGPSVHGVTSTQFKLTRNWIHDTDNWGCVNSGSSDVVYEDNHVENVYTHGLYADGNGAAAFRVRIANNTVISALYDATYTNSGIGISVQATGTPVQEVVDVQVLGNTVKSCGSMGLSLTGTAQGSSPSATTNGKLVCSSNLVEGHTSNAGFGIELIGANYIVSNNVVKNNLINLIFSEVKSTDIIIDANKFISATNSAQAHVRISPVGLLDNAERISITNNQFNGGAYSVHITSVATTLPHKNIKISNNQFIASTYGVLFQQTATNCQIENNTYEGAGATIQRAFQIYGDQLFVRDNTVNISTTDDPISIGGACGLIEITGNYANQGAQGIYLNSVVTKMVLGANDFSGCTLNTNLLATPTTFVDLNTNTWNFGTVAPTTGPWKVGQRRFNSVPAVGQPKSWVCTVAGTPGTWVSEGNL